MLPLYTLHMGDDVYAVQAAVVGKRKASAQVRPKPLVQGKNVGFQRFAKLRTQGLV